MAIHLEELDIQHIEIKHRAAQYLLAAAKAALELCPDYILYPCGDDEEHDCNGSCLLKAAIAKAEGN